MDSILQHIAIHAINFSDKSWTLDLIFTGFRLIFRDRLPPLHIAFLTTPLVPVLGQLLYSATAKPNHTNCVKKVLSIVKQNEISAFNMHDFFCQPCSVAAESLIKIYKHNDQSIY